MVVDTKLKKPCTAGTHGLVKRGRTLPRSNPEDGIQSGAHVIVSARRRRAILFLDLDNVKRLIDHYGHHAGDEVLRGVAKTLKDHVSGAGIAGRSGNEEFLVTASGLSKHDARRLAQSAVTSVRDAEFPGLAPLRPVTCGVCTMWGELESDVTTERLIADILLRVFQRRAFHQADDAVAASRVGASVHGTDDRHG